MPVLPTDPRLLRDLFAKEFPILFDESNEFVRPYAEDYVNISLFLMQKKAVINELEELNLLCLEIYERKAAANEITWPDIYNGVGPEATLKPFGSMKFRKVLTEALEQREDHWGFNQGAIIRAPKSLYRDPSFALKSYKFAEGEVSGSQEVGPNTHLPKGVPTLNDFVDPDDFKNLLLQYRYQFKDPGAGADHGEFTHRLQWFAVCSAHERDNLQLTNAPAALFAFLAGDCCESKTMQKQGSKPFGLWDCLVDAFRTTQGEPHPMSSDFRSPNVLHDYLNSPEALASDKVGLLAHILKNRAAKREREGAQQGVLPKWQRRILSGVEGYVTASMGSGQQAGTVNFLDRTRKPA